MSVILTCPCGEWLEAPSEDELVALAKRHLAESHPGLDYGREEILALSIQAPQRSAPGSSAGR